jgi:phosphoenolpyruvate carboxykinase (GTP)
MRKFPDPRSWVEHPKLLRWIEEMIALCAPAHLHLCDGTEDEFHQLTKEMEEKGLFVSLNPLLRPSSFWCHSHPDDVARSEEATFVCSDSKEDAGPTNNWRDPKEMKAELLSLFKGCMQGRTLYVIPFSMGPLGSSFARIGVQITDSPYVVCSMKIMTHMGKDILPHIKDDFIPCIHSVGVPLKEGQKDMIWPFRADQKHIVQFPDDPSIWSFGSGYGGNALLGKKCLSLRIGSVIAQREGWLAEHMLIMGVTNPEGEKKYFAAAFPSGCGKTNLAMMTPTLPGWKVECVGDDIAWMHFGEDGRLWAINPETGFFGIAPGTSWSSNLQGMRTIAENTIFTNVAITPERDVWWEGMTPNLPDLLTSWKEIPWTPHSKEKAAHPNARFTTPASQCPIIDPHWQDLKGVPISGILFGGRRSRTTPLVFEAFDWQHGVFIGASVSSKTTSAAIGETGKLRHDPFSMLPFCGYNMGDYFSHWFAMGKKTAPHKLPRIFHVNWFRKSSKGDFLWPGFGENSRVIKWIFERCEGKENAETTPIGYLPKKEALDLSGLALEPNALELLLSVDREAWLEEVNGLKEYFKLFGDRLPPQIEEECLSLQRRL